MTIHYPDNTASRTAITASGLTDSTALLDVYSGGERSLTLAELKKTGVQVLNAKQYGLRGDGITDDTTQFLLFCSGAAAANLVAYFPPGTYILNSLPTYGYQVSSNLRVLGESATLKGNSTSGHDEPFTLISGANFTCEGVTFDTFYIPIWGESTFNGKLKVANCKFTNCQIGIASSTATPSKVTITDNEFTAYLHKGVAWLGVSNAHVLVADNLLYDASGSNIQTGIQVGDNGDLVSKSIIVERNRVRNQIRTALGTSIGILTNGNSARVEQNTLENVYVNLSGNADNEAGIYSKTLSGSISNNTLINAGRGNGCIVWKGGANGCNITNNTIVMGQSGYSPFIGIRAYLNNGIISSNFLNGSGGSVNTGILLGETLTNITLMNNYLFKCVHVEDTGRAISVPGGINIAVLNNVIRECGTAKVGSLSYGIDAPASSTMKNLRISNNEIEQPTYTTYSTAIRVESTTVETSGLSINNNVVGGYHNGITTTNTANGWSSVSICNNDIDFKSVGGAGVISYGINLTNVKKGAISYNTIRNGAGDATTICGAINLISSISGGLNNLNVTNNNIMNMTSSNQYYGGGVILISTVSNPVYNIDISDNIVKVARRGIILDTYANDYNIRLANNHIYGITGLNASDDYYFPAVSNFIIYGNMEDFTLHSINSSSLLTAAPIFLKSSVALTQGSGASTATLTNSPAVGNPTKWIPINDNGTTRYIPCW